MSVLLACFSMRWSNDKCLPSMLQHEVADAWLHGFFMRCRGDLASLKSAFLCAPVSRVHIRALLTSTALDADSRHFSR
jgi:hypothetical protein